MEDYVESFLVSVNAIAPILLLAIIGYLIKVKSFISDLTFQELNKLCFKVFLPILLFKNIYTTEAELIIPWKLMLFCLLFIVALFILLSIVIPYFVKEKKRQGVVIQGIFRSNYIILGIPIASAVYGGENIAIISIMAAVIVPLYNFLAVLTLTIHGEERLDYKNLIKNLISNPLIIGSFLGIIFYGLKIPMPNFVLSTIESISAMATPLSIIILGGSLKISKILDDKILLQISVFSRLILVPVAAVCIGILLGFKNMELLAILTIFATPTAVSSYVMAEQMNGDGELAANIVIFSSMLSCFTIFAFVYILSYLSFI